MKKTALFVALAFAGTTLFAQKKITSSATIQFDATTSIDALPKAENKTAVASLDTKTGALAFEALIKGFNFSNPMIQDHFNGAKWLDSEQFPKSTFKGKISNIAAVNFTKDGSYEVEVEGALTIHGKTNEVKTKGTLVVAGKAVTATANFSIVLSDYGVDVSNSGGKIAKEPKITVEATFN